MGVQEMIEIIQQVGFPIVVALYLLWRYDKRLSSVENTLTKIATLLEQISELEEHK